MLSSHLNFIGIKVGIQDLFLIMRCLRQDSAKRIRDEAATPKFDPVRGGVIAWPTHRFAVVFHISMLVADPIDRADEDPIGDGVCALDGLPGVILPLPELDLLARVPADGGREEESFSALEGGDPSSFWIPLVPADQCSDGPC